MKRGMLIIVISALAFESVGAAPNGEPFRALQEQVDAIGESLTTLEHEFEIYRTQAYTRIEKAETQIATLESKLRAETQARVAAEQLVQQMITQETAARVSADRDLLDKIEDSSLPPSLLNLAEFVNVVPGTVNGLLGPHVIFEGANVHIRSGYGATNDGGSPSGLGNLIIGYNEPRETATKEILDAHLGILARNCVAIQDPWDFDSNTGPGTTVPGCPANPVVQQSRRTGSHNLIVGDYHNFNSYGGIVGGIFNATDQHAVGASVLGGDFNLVTHPLAVVVSGTRNRAQAHGSSILGGRLNRTVTLAYGSSTTPIPPWPVETYGSTEAWSSIVAGRSNFVSSMEGAVVGGLGNIIKGTNTSVIVGGQGNYITLRDEGTIGDDVVILGGYHITATEGGQVQPLDASIEALAVAILEGKQGCSEGTEQFFEMMSNVPGLGDLFGWLGSGCDIW